MFVNRDNLRAGPAPMPPTNPRISPTSPRRMRVLPPTVERRWKVVEINWNFCEKVFRHFCEKLFPFWPHEVSAS